MVNAINPNLAGNVTYNQPVATVPQGAAQKIAEQIPDTFASTAKGAVKSSLLWNGIPAGLFVKNARKTKDFITSSGKAIRINKTLVGMDNEILKSFKNIAKGKKGTVFNRIGNFFTTVQENQKSYGNLKNAVKESKNLCKTIEKGKTLDKINAATAKAGIAGDTFIDPNGTTLKLAKDNVTRLQNAAAANPGSKKAAKALKAATKKLDKLTKASTKPVNGFSKLMKDSGAKFMLILSSVIELATEVIPTFKELGPQKGLKQTAKSAVKVVGDTFGWVAGSQLGSAVGGVAGAFVSAKLSAVAGTAVCPGLGTIAGALLGFVGGLCGSWAMRKLTAPITKSERQIAQEQQKAMQPSQEQIFTQNQTVQEGRYIPKAFPNGIK